MAHPLVNKYEFSLPEVAPNPRAGPQTHTSKVGLGFRGLGLGFRGLGLGFRVSAKPPYFLGIGLVKIELIFEARDPFDPDAVQSI